jgi:hypothetical protein
MSLFIHPSPNYLCFVAARLIQDLIFVKQIPVDATGILRIRARAAAILARVGESRQCAERRQGTMASEAAETGK